VFALPVVSRDSHRLVGVTPGPSSKWLEFFVLQINMLCCRCGGYTAQHLGNIVKHLHDIFASLVSDAVLFNGRLCYWRIETLMSVQFPPP
jgi:hypothetical protein